MWLAYCALTIFCRGNVNGDISHCLTPGPVILDSLLPYWFCPPCGTLDTPSSLGSHRWWFPRLSPSEVRNMQWGHVGLQLHLNQEQTVWSQWRATTGAGQVETVEQKQSCSETQTSIRASLCTSPKTISPELGILFRTGNEFFFTLNNTHDTDEWRRRGDRARNKSAHGAH